LLAKPVPGRPPKVTPEQMRWIAQTVRDDTPQQFKFPYSLWTLSLIGQLIERRFGTSLSLASVSRVMKLLGFSAQKPLYQAWQQDPVLVRRWGIAARRDYRLGFGALRDTDFCILCV
jgi:transposase